MGSIVICVMFFMLLAMLVWVWIGGINNIMKNHPDYKGDDLFGLDDDDINQIG